jgi:hypothetical protein
MEAVVVSIPFAVPVYERCGFDVLVKIDADVGVGEGKTSSEEWKEWEKDNLQTFFMVRRRDDDKAKANARK